MNRLFLLLVIILFPIVAKGELINGIYYWLNSTDQTATVYSGQYYPSPYSGDIVIPNEVIYKDKAYNVVAIADETFKNNSSLTSVSIPNSINNIGYMAFQYCPKLYSARIPESVTYIGMYVFRDCNGLRSITIGGGEVVLEDCAFSGLNSLQDFFCHSTTLPNIIDINHYTGLKDYIFNGSQYNATLHVPAVSVDLYKTQKPWSEFKKIVALTEEEMGIATTYYDGEIKGCIFNLSGQRAKKTKGRIYIIKNSKGRAKIMMMR